MLENRTYLKQEGTPKGGALQLKPPPPGDAFKNTQSLLQ